jgi:hypothetical protein
MVAMVPAAAFKVFEAMIDAAKADGAPVSITLQARPVIAAHHPGDTVAVVAHNLPAGTEPTEPDALALELHVAGQLGQPVPASVVAKAAEHGLRVGTSDLLLV